jgi:hypothetical protein
MLSPAFFAATCPSVQLHRISYRQGRENPRSLAAGKEDLPDRPA